MPDFAVILKSVAHWGIKNTARTGRLGGTLISSRAAKSKVAQKGTKETAPTGGFEGTLISSRATGFTAGGGGLRRSISVAFAATASGRRALSAMLFVLTAV